MLELHRKPEHVQSLFNALACSVLQECELVNYVRENCGKRSIITVNVTHVF